MMSCASARLSSATRNCPTVRVVAHFARRHVCRGRCPGRRGWRRFARAAAVSASRRAHRHRHRRNRRQSLSRWRQSATDCARIAQRHDARIGAGRSLPFRCATGDQRRGHEWPRRQRRSAAAGAHFDNARSYLMWAFGARREKLGLAGRDTDQMSGDELRKIVLKAMTPRSWDQRFRDLVHLADPRPSTQSRSAPLCRSRRGRRSASRC